MELGSKHPLAHAFKAEGMQQNTFDSLSVVPGHGIQARQAGQDYKLGKAGFAAPEQPDTGIWLSRNNQLLAHFTLEDPIKADALACIENLRGQSLHCHLLSGDSLAHVREAADALHLDNYQARLGPEGKMQYLQALQQSGGTVLMIGDGINDAPVLAQADVSMAMGSGAYVAQSNADILLMNSKLSQIGLVLSVAKHMRHLMRQNLHWAIAYNVLAVGVALSGLIHPGYASLGMAGSSLLVTLNALRIYRITP
jgi:Cu2+-exporting ATPase